jgi:nucleotide-binding universal stress UspA family protein
MYTRILVPLDGSKLAEQVLPYVRALAPALQAQVHLVRVEVAFAPLHQSYPGVMEAETHRAEGYLEEIAASLREDDLTLSCAVVEGRPAACIAAEAKQEPGTIIAMTSHGRSGFTRWLLGSVANEVLQAAANPLLIIKASDQEPSENQVKLEHVLVPLDGSEQAEKILALVGQLTSALTLPVTLVRVTPTRESYYRYADYPIVDWEDLATQVDAEAAEYLHQAGQKLRRQGGSSVEERLLHGSPAEAIMDLARETPGNMVMMTTHGRSGAGRLVLGSIADRVVRHSGNPVLLVRIPFKGED